MAQAMKMQYDKENDILSIHKGFADDEIFDGNMVAGDLVLDMSSKGRVRGIELLNASKFLKDLGIPKTALLNLREGDFVAESKPNGIFLNLILKGEKTVSAKLAVPMTI